MALCPQCGQDNRDGARFCDSCGEPLAAPHTREVRKTVTVLFADVAGSTALGERLDPESVRRVMAQYFQAAREAIEYHGGTVEKFIGDAVMAVFGIPLAHEDDALRAIRAAVDVRDSITSMSGELEGRFGTGIAIRIGVNTGEVVAGDASARQTIVTGDAVNVAARLEQHAAAGQILLGEDTYRLVDRAVTAEPVEPIAAKGKAERVPGYRLISVDPAGGIRRLDRPLVGRLQELAQLRRLFDEAVAERRCHLATVVGEPGVGKSRLARELIEQLRGEARILEGHYLSYGEGITYWPIAEIVKRAAGVRDDDSLEAAREKLNALVAGKQQHSALVAERVAQAIGLAEGHAASTDEIAWAIRSLLVALAREQPLLIVVDDIQWGEAALLDLLASLPERIGEVPLACLCLARPELLESRPDWTVTRRLEPLSDAEATALLPLDAAGREKIVLAAGGNPLFIEELAEFLAEGGHAGTLPPNLSALLGARLDRLSDAERSTIECASVEGEIFHRGAVSTLAQYDVANELERLRKRDFVRVAQAQFVDEAGFRFRHILVRETAYKGATKTLRAELHERFADWLEQKAGARVAEVEEILGYHLEQAHRYQSELGPLTDEGIALGHRAGRRLATAGLRALDRGDAAAAVNLLSRAAALLPADSPARLTLMLRLGNARIEMGGYAEAVPVFREVVDRSQQIGERRIELRAAMELILLEGFTDNPEGQGAQLVAMAKEAIPLFEQAGDHAALARAWHLVSHDDWAGCRFGPRAEALERGLAHAERSGDKRSQAELMGWLSTAIALGPTPAEPGIRRCEELLRQAEGHRAVEAHVRGAQAILTAMRGRFPEARELYDAARQIYRELGLVHWEASRTLNGAIVELTAGEAAAAARELEWGLGTFEAMGERNVWSTLAAFLALALAIDGRYEEAAETAQKSEDATAPGDIINEILCRRARVKVLAWQGTMDQAEALARDAVKRAQATDMLSLHGDTLLDLAEVLQALGRQQDAGATIGDALRLYEVKGNLVSAERARHLGAELAVAR